MKKIILLLLFAFSGNTKTTIKVNYEGPGLPLKHFWKSTGLCPLGSRNETYKFLLSKDETLNLMYIGAIPNKGIKYVRIHWLLNILQLRNRNKIVTYNYRRLDLLMDWMKRQKLRVGFEIMGIPSGSEGDIAKTTFWYDIVYNLTKRYTAKYGYNYVKRWRFETWNEPDLRTYNILNFTLEKYLSYVTSCRKAIQDVFKLHSKPPKLGGPAGVFKNPKNHPLCWGLLEKCNRNLTSCPIQYISFHKKGNSSARNVVQEDQELIQTFRLKFPNLRHLPIANDEADVLVNWSKSEEWRGDVRYAAMIVQVIIEHLKKISLGLRANIEALSNDNAFLSYHPYYFTQRTLLARFQMNKTSPPHTQFIKKPVYSVMALLALLGDEFLQEEDVITHPDLSVSYLATRFVKNKEEPKTFTLIVAYANDTEVDDQKSKSVEIRMTGLLPGSRYAIYLMDNIVTNPFGLWKASGSPVFPSDGLRKHLRLLEEPLRLRAPSDLSNSTLDIRINLRMPSVVLVQVCSDNGQAPGRVSHLQAFNITKNEVLLVWKDTRVRSKCLLTYEVEFQAENSSFRRINRQDTTFLSFHFTAQASFESETTRGKYRVRAVDYWNVSGEYSKCIDY